MRVEDFYAPSQIGRTRFLTPEGFLVCKDVAIARTGEQAYLPSEIRFEDGSRPVPASDGVVYVERSAEDVFRAETIASFEGKPITDEHPSEEVNPTNWRKHVIGHLQHVRRGEGDDSGLLMADLFVTDAKAIADVQARKRQVSCGYDAAYSPTGLPGRVKQSGIVGNHLALVNRGRAGPRCAIGDQAMPEVTTKPKGFLEKVRDAFHARDEGALTAVLADVTVKDAPSTAVPITGDASALDAALARALTPVLAQVAALEARLPTKDAAKEETDEEKAARLKREKEEADKTKDALPAADLAMIVSRSEILAPGFKLPTMDSATVDAACNAQRAALKQALATDAGKAAVTPFLGTRDVDTLDASAVSTVFTAAAELRRVTNNTKTADGIRPGVSTKDFGRAALSPAEINAKNAAHWAAQRSVQS